MYLNNHDNLGLRGSSIREEKNVPEDIALFIDFENIRYSMLNIQRREPDPQELIAVARRYGTVMVARAYADWSRQPEPFKGSLTAAMIDRVDCPAKQRDRIRPGTVHYPGNNPPTSGLGSSGSDQPTGGFQRPWSAGSTGSTGPLPVITPQGPGNGWASYHDAPLPLQSEFDENPVPADESPSDESYNVGTRFIAPEEQESPRQNVPYQNPY